MPYYQVSPGPVEDVTAYISVPGEPNAAAGDLYFLTVLVQQVSALEYVNALFDNEIDLRQRDTIRPPGVSQDQLNAANASLMQESIDRAIFVALTELGYGATLTGEGAVVSGLVEDSPAVGLLLAADVITSIDGEVIRLAGDAVAFVARSAPGDNITLGVIRPDPNGDDEPLVLEIPVVLGDHPEDDTRGFIGVFLDSANVVAEFELDVSINAGNIGGPSAGLMYTLEIMNLLTEEDLTQGRQIAGTGTIEFDGDVGPIGGVRQKVFAAIDAGAYAILVPEENFADAEAAASGDIEIVSVDRLEDALAFLRSLQAAVPASAAGS